MSISNDLEWIQSVHDLLPPSVHAALSFVLLEHVEHADYIYSVIVAVLMGLVILQSHAFARPPPVPLKRLPKRPLIQFYFKPDDVTNSILADNSTKAAQQQSSQSIDNRSTSTWTKVRRSLSSTIFHKNKEEEATMVSGKEDHTLLDEKGGHVDSDADSFLDHRLGLDIEEEEEEESIEQTTPLSFSTDLPDSFAPLLSSSQVEVETNQLPADVIHAVQVKAEVRLRSGRHEIPLDMDQSRPQFILDVPAGGCRISAVVAVGSDGFSSYQDLDASVPTTQRSKPMVKHAGLVLDPPLPLSNLAPTLIHFPTLFEDNFVPTLRRIQIVRYFIDFIISISSFLEKCLWILETKCKIHLTKVRITPVYKGSKDSSPDWRLSLAFSGHVLLFGSLPVPFISVVLPTFIIPQPHALLDKLLTKQPLASAKLRRECIDEEKIGLAAIEAAEQWSTDVKVVATPPAVGLDITLPGGATMALKLVLGRDSNAETTATMDEDPPLIPEPRSPAFKPNGGSSVDESMSSFSTREEPLGPRSRRQKFRGAREPRSSNSTVTNVGPYDANVAVPWSFQFKAKGKIDHDKMTFRLVKLMARQQRSSTSIPLCKFESTGSFAIWKVGPDPGMSPTPLRRKVSRSTFATNRPVLDSEESPSVSAVLLFPEETTSFRHDQKMLTYDYEFDVSDDSCLDAITLSVGATHPMLKGATAVTTIFESLYCYGSMGAREDSILDPMERKRKRNILRHLPAIDFTFGVQNVFMPPESHPYSDDGQTLFLPEMEGGRLTARVLGGIQDTGHPDMPSDAVYEGVKLIADFEVGSLNLKSQGNVKEFPELDIFEGDQLRTILSGMIGGSIRAHLRPQALESLIETTGKNIYNPLEAYEIEFSGSNLNVKMKEFTATLGHRRIIFPTETAFVVSVIDSIVDMGFEGRTQCDLSWDFNGLSPILQVTSKDQTPESAGPENKQQVSLLISPLRFGLFSFHVSSVGGIQIKKAATAREDKDGLFDWKFFNALVSPDETSIQRILDVVHDKRTMKKLLQVTELVNKDLHKILQYVLKQVWRAKEIFDAEGVTDPANVIPMYKMSRLVTLFITGDVKEIDKILPIVGKVVNGEGLDVVKVKELLREHLDFYEDWAPELDRALRWAEVMFAPQSVSPTFVEDNVMPLAEISSHAAKLRGIPSATELYEKTMDKPQLPLEPSFSNLVGRVAPYLGFCQIEFLLHARTASDWQQADLRRLRYVYSVKRKVLEIAESYGGLSFLPQSFLVSVFLGEATRNSHRAPQKRPVKKLRSKLSIPMKGTNMLKTSGFSNRGLGANRFRSDANRNIDSLGMSNITPPSVTKEAIPSRVFVGRDTDPDDEEEYALGDCLLGPQDVAILLQSGLTSVMKSSTVVQLNQRMLLDLICTQPRSFAIAVLAEIGMPSGQGDPRSLTSALMNLLELDQTAFKAEHQVDMPALLESWLPGLKMPRREDYMAGGRWARQSYYESIFAVAKSILDDAETYSALKSHIQLSRQASEYDPIPIPKEEYQESTINDDSRVTSRLLESITKAKRLIEEADILGNSVADAAIREGRTKPLDEYEKAVQAYQKAFKACAVVVEMDKHAFHAVWFANFYKRNYDALMIKNMYDNVVSNVDHVRHWLHALRNGALAMETHTPQTPPPATLTQTTESGDWEPVEDSPIELDTFFLEPETHTEQEIVDAIIHATIYYESDRDRFRKDPLVRLLIPNPPGKYNFTIISAMGVITEGKKGLELKDAFARLEKERGVRVIRADTGTARSLEYNASKIEDAINEASKLQRPFGLLGYSQGELNRVLQKNRMLSRFSLFLLSSGCANILKIESLMLSGTPRQRELISCPKAGLVCRQLLFSAANGSAHGPAVSRKVQKLIVMCEEFFKYQQGYVSRALASSVLEILNNSLDSSQFHKMMGGVQVFLPDGCRAFWRESQNLVSVLLFFLGFHI